MKQSIFDFLCRKKSPQDDVMEKLCEAEAERKKLVTAHMFETRDQYRKELAHKLVAQTTICMQLEREAGMY